MPANFRYRDANGFDIISGPTKDLGALVSSPSAVVLGDPIKICCENMSDRPYGASPFAGLVMRRSAVGDSDGVGYIRSALDPNGTISRPWGLDTSSSIPTGAPTAENIGGPYGAWGATGVYGVVVVATKGAGRTIASEEKRITVVDVGDSWRYAWVKPPGGCDGYEVYRTDTPGTYGAYTLIAEIGDGDTVTFDDDGSAPIAGAPPEENTTGGAGPYYGDDPADGAFGTADLTMFSAPNGMAVGQEFFFYFRSRLSAGASSLTNPRDMDLLPVEV